MMPYDRDDATGERGAADDGGAAAASSAADEHSARARASGECQVNAARRLAWLRAVHGCWRCTRQAWATTGGGAAKLGAGGDFTTAPEVSRLFGACVAVQCAGVLRGTQAPDPCWKSAPAAACGRGSAGALGGLGPAAGQVRGYSRSSADLRQRQRERLEKRLPQSASPRPLARSAAGGSRFDGVILANEVLDALPVARFRWHPSAVEELGVEIREGGRGGGRAHARRCTRGGSRGGKRPGIRVGRAPRGPRRAGYLRRELAARVGLQTWSSLSLVPTISVLKAERSTNFC